MRPYTPLVDLHLSPAPVGQLLDGRYRVESTLARGGMATVYRAVDIRLDRVVALKMVHTELAADEGFVARFIEEARSAARLSHPAVVAVFDQGEDSGTVYLAMEYIEGRTLRQVLREIVGGAYCVSLCMRKLALDNLMVPALFVQ